MKKRAGAGLVLLGLLVVAGTAAQIVPMAVSPGSERGVALVGQVCPTFSWTAVDWASGYRVAVFEALGVQVPSYEEMAAGMVPALSKEIAGRALAWTPSSEEQLIAGSLYVWYVQAADGSGQGTWSKGKLFIVEAGILASGTEGWLKKTLEEKGVREDVISDVLKEMKVEGRGVISGKTDSKPQGKVGALGSEGPNNTLLWNGCRGLHHLRSVQHVHWALCRGIHQFRQRQHLPRKLRRILQHHRLLQHLPRKLCRTQHHRRLQHLPRISSRILQHHRLQQHFPWACHRCDEHHRIRQHLSRISRRILEHRRKCQHLPRNRSWTLQYHRLFQHLPRILRRIRQYHRHFQHLPRI